MSLLITCDTGGWKTPSRLRSRLEGTELESADTMRDRSVIAGTLHTEPMPHAGTQARPDNQAHPDVAALLDTQTQLDTHAKSSNQAQTGLMLRTGIDRESNLAARRLAYRSGAMLVCNEYRGDLIDVGHSLHHRELYPAAVRALPQSTRDAIVEEIYVPYRNQVERAILHLLTGWSYVVHLSVRTYDAKTSQGKWRRGDVGLLYDPSHPDEVDWCLDLIEELYAISPDLKVRRNHPGRGTNDSLTKAMRGLFSQEVYLGIELVLNRAWMARPVIRRELVLDKIGDAIGSLTAEPAARAA
ncbi:N-formylglutamate amidohydrolase [Rhodopirellula sp. SWK7]|uniref:N-formylglutamate amidohydrolase n=1 Tax=Rhodopirellula sp. SWK7 TaxID=595460 RepID=UPI0002BFD5D9|nr:N-formylglutamate amidohydrolase [Rhodopirellula sp. SWK7]EMI41027.1 N-formylglutamate amidohydrolase [Rhodopirellula sp. SWK7]